MEASFTGLKDSSVLDSVLVEKREAGAVSKLFVRIDYRQGLELFLLRPEIATRLFQGIIL